MAVFPSAHTQLASPARSSSLNPQPLLTPPPSPGASTLGSPSTYSTHLAPSAGGPFRPTLRRATTTDSGRPGSSSGSADHSSSPRPLTQTMPRLPPLPGLGSPIEFDSPPQFGDRPRSLVRNSSAARKPSGLSASTSSTAAPDFAFLAAPPPARTPRRPQTAPGGIESNDGPFPSKKLSAGSARSNYFNLDFSFLDDEPPPMPTRNSSAAIFGPRKKQSANSINGSPKSTHSRMRDSTMSTDSADENRSALAQKSPSIRSVSSSSMPFPSRPRASRQKSSESNPSGKTPYPGRSSLLLPVVSDKRRPSMASSFNSFESNGSSSLSPERTSPKLGFIVRPTEGEDEDGEEAQSRRKRLAQFLNETAAAMEGGKSLAMVLPEAAHGDSDSEKPTLSLGQLAEATSPRGTSITTFSTINWSGVTPRQQQGEDCATPTNRASQHRRSTRESVHRDTVYFTPDPSEHSPRSSSNSLQLNSSSGEDDNEDAVESLQSGHYSGLGLGMDSHSASSPSTVRASSPAGSHLDEAKPMDEKKAKAAEKRRRIIEELLETETSYAIDMVVVRDIYLARARGADMTAIADHVMSTGLGLGGAMASPPSPTIQPGGQFYNMSSPAGSRADLRRPSLMPGPLDRRPSLMPGPLDRRPSALAQRRPTLMPSQPILLPGQPLMSSKDIHTIFANLEEVAGLAEAFAGVLDGARGDGVSVNDDNIGEVFVEMIPRIQQVYSTYCARHHQAIIRLQELEASLKSYFSECKTLSHGRTNAWDLASLLIKPVQRCLKYPLLLDQILAVTPEDHPDLANLKRANTDMLMVAEHINEVKKRHDVVNKVIKKDINLRRPSMIPAGMTKKLLRSGQKAKIAIGLGDAGANDDMFDTLATLVESTKSGVLRFSAEMREWSKTTKSALESQVTLVEGWIDLYAPKDGGKSVPGSSHDRLCYFLEDVLMPVIDGPWRTLDHQVRRELITKTDHLLSLFDNPSSVIAKRNDKLLDHQRYLAKKLPADKKGSEDYLTLTAQLMEELPRFLGSVSRYFNIIVGHFATAQATYHEAVQEAWTAFSDAWMHQIPEGADLESSFASQHGGVAQMMDTLAAGLGIASAQPGSPRAHSIRARNRLSGAPTNHGSPRPPRPASQVAASDSRASFGLGDYSIAPKRVDHRSSVQSDASTPSFSVSSGGGSSHGAPVTPPLLPVNGFAGRVGKRESDQSLGSPRYDQRALAAKYEQPLPSVPTSSDEYSSDSSADPAQGAINFSSPFDQPRVRTNVGRRALETHQKLMSTYSVYVPAEEDLQFDPLDEEDDEDESAVLYMAEAMADSHSNAVRGGYPVLSFRAGDRFAVEQEEADHAEGGCGWLLGRTEDGRMGWARTEDFAMIEEEE